MRFLSPAVLLTTIASALAAQDPPAPAERKHTFGIGVSLSPAALFIDDGVGLVPVGLSNFLIPMRFSPKFTLEAEIGVTRFESSSGGSGGAPLTENSSSNTRFGLGFLGDFGSQGPLKPYIGLRIVRLGVTQEFSSGTSNLTTTSRGWTFAGVVGGQHFFSDVFSLGGEVQLSRSSFGEPEVSGSPAPGPGFGNDKSSFFGTNGLITLRWFP